MLISTGMVADWYPMVSGDGIADPKLDSEVPTVSCLAVVISVVMCRAFFSELVKLDEAITEGWNANDA